MTTTTTSLTQLNMLPLIIIN